MELINILQSLIVDEPNSNIAYLVQDSNLKQIIQNIIEERLSENIDLSRYNLNRLPFLGEHFETVIIENDEVLTDRSFAKEIAKVVQKNRIVILITELNIENLKEVYEPLDFTDFSSVDKNIIVMKRWFKW